MGICYTHVYLSLLHLLILFNSSTAQNVCVVCYDSSVGEGGCVPANQITTRSYVDCCLLPEGGSVSRNSYQLEQQQQCSTCGPVLDEPHFLPVMTTDNSIITIQWALHPRSLPATSYTMLVSRDKEGGQRLTNVTFSSEAPATRHQFSPVIAGVVYNISVKAVNEPLGLSSPLMTIMWTAGEDILPTFTNFSASLLSPDGTLVASWEVLTPGLRPLLQVTVRWVELSSVGPDDDLNDLSSSVFSLTNIATVDYDTKSTVVMKYDVISVTLSGLVVNEIYVVAVTGTNVLDSKTTVFTFTTAANETLSELPSTGEKAHSPPTLLLTLLLPLAHLIHVHSFP